MRLKTSLNLIIGFLLGLPLSFAVCGVYGWIGPGSLTDNYLLILWFIVPVFISVMSGSLFIRKLSYLVPLLVLLNGVVWGMLWFVR